MELAVYFAQIEHVLDLEEALRPVEIERLPGFLWTAMFDDMNAVLFAHGLDDGGADLRELIPQGGEGGGLMVGPVGIGGGDGHGSLGGELQAGGA